MHRPPMGNKNRGVRPDNEFVLSEQEHHDNKSYRVKESIFNGWLKYLSGILISVLVIVGFILLIYFLAT